MSKKLKFGLIMSVYNNTNADYFQQSISSVLDQAFDLSEKLIVVDGPVNDRLDDLLTTLEPEGFTIHRLEENRGLGLALRHGVEMSTADYLFRMDDDDINCPDRFRLQAEAALKNPDASVIAGQIVEFEDNNQDRKYIRACPTDPAEIKRQIRHRNVVNHVTCLIRRQDILACGNYRPDTTGYEDYDLWIRLINSGGKIVNLDDVLVKVRFSERQFASRFGWRPAVNEAKMQRQFLKEKYISIFDFIYNCCFRLSPRLLPIFLARPLFRFFQRQPYHSTKS